jgi:hypothetical protein
MQVNELYSATNIERAKAVQQVMNDPEYKKFLLEQNKYQGMSERQWKDKPTRQRILRLEQLKRDETPRKQKYVERLLNDIQQEKRDRINHAPTQRRIDKTEQLAKEIDAYLETLLVDKPKSNIFWA